MYQTVRIDWKHILAIVRISVRPSNFLYAINTKTIANTASHTRLFIWTSRVPVEGKSSVCVICMKYRIMILIIIIISLGQILLSYIAHTLTHTHRHRSGCRCSMAPIRDGVNAPFRRFRWRSMAGRWFIQINTRAGDPVSLRFWVFFAFNKIARANWDANSWQEVLSVDANSLRHLPRRSSKNWDLQFANTDRQTLGELLYSHASL